MNNPHVPATAVAVALTSHLVDRLCVAVESLELRPQPQQRFYHHRCSTNTVTYRAAATIAQGKTTCRFFNLTTLLLRRDVSSSTTGGVMSVPTGDGRCIDQTNGGCGLPSPNGGGGHHRDRSRTTQADAYYQRYGKLPKPPQMHMTLDGPSELNGKINTESDQQHHCGILVVGDVHGCHDELLLLHETAMKQHNQGKPFAHVILVGDLVNKCPQSLQVVRHVRTTPRWWSIRGNHDNSALLAALGDPSRQDKSTYQWIWGKQQQPKQQPEASEYVREKKENVNEDETYRRASVLSDDDVQWMADLPYTIRIPRSLLHQFVMEGSSNKEDHDDNEDDILIVHAGLVPDVPLEEQTIRTMVTIRTIEPTSSSENTTSDSSNDDTQEQQQQQQPQKQDEEEWHHRRQWKYSEGDDKKKNAVPWASIWNGPFDVIFGHDARRGLQRYPKAIGLDTGVVYGKRLTGLVLPQKALVSVPAVAEHSPIPIHKATAAAKNSKNKEEI